MPDTYGVLLSHVVIIVKHEAPVRNVKWICGDHVNKKRNESSKPENFSTRRTENDPVNSNFIGHVKGEKITNHCHLYVVKIEMCPGAKVAGRLLIVNVSMSATTKYTNAILCSVKEIESVMITNLKTKELSRMSEEDLPEVFHTTGLISCRCHT